MSSSRIIKSEQLQPDNGISEFSFKPIGQGASAPAGEAHGSGFVPLGFFDPSQLPGYEDVAAENAEELPAGSFISDEDLDQQLRESFNSGLQEGKNLAERGLVNVFRALRSSTEGIHALREKVLRESEDELVKLIIAVARKVIQREVSQDRGILARVIQAAMTGLHERDEVTIRLSPDDHAMITSGYADYFKNELASDRMHFKPDPQVAPGDCLVDCEMGTINASIDAQLEEVYRRLLEERTAAFGSGS